MLHYCSLPLCYVHVACSQLWSALQLLVYVPTSCRLQHCRIWSLHCRVHAALTAALERGGLGWSLICSSGACSWGEETESHDHRCSGPLYLELGSLVCSCSAAADCRTVQHGDGELENTIDLFNPWPRAVCAVAPPLTAACHSPASGQWTQCCVKCVQDTAHPLQCCRFRLQCEFRYLGPLAIRKCKGHPILNTTLESVKYFRGPHIGRIKINLESNQKLMTSFLRHSISF